MADDVTHYDAVEAYTDRLSYLPGEAADLHVWCATERYDVDVRRWGGEVCWQATDLPGTAHPTPDDADARGCGWPAGVQVPISSTWTSGVYLVTLHAHGAAHDRAIGHAMFVVRAKPTGAVRGSGNPLLVLATNTYNAYNNWGGRSLYTGGHQVSFDRPFGRGMLLRPHTERDDRKSRPTLPGEEPDTDGTVYQQYRFQHGYPGYMSSAGWFTYERRFVEWAERNDITLDYAVSSDLEHTPSVVAESQLVLGVGHDEYWSAAQRDTIEAHVAAGGNYASMSGNTMFWQVRLGEHGRTMTAHKYSAHRNDPVLGTADEHTMSGMWCDPLVGRPEWRFLGAGSAFGLYSRFGQATPRASGGFTVYRNDHWMFDGTGLRYGDQLGAAHGAVGYETVGCRLGFDAYGLPISMNVDAPPHTEIVAFAPASNLGEGDYPASVAASSDQCDLEFVAERLYGDTSPDSLARVRYGNATMLTCRPAGDAGGTVATIGSTDWVYGLDDPMVSQVTANVVRRLR
ncbi:MAG: hypothetical protein Q8M22_08540 [Actinomycetota bacterium]|nr:hypothetical protein [Actinomycetota bacterium]